MKQLDHVRASRTPKCAAATNTVLIRLTDDEKAALSTLAEQDSRSMAAMARLIYLKGVSTLGVE